MGQTLLGCLEGMQQECQVLSVGPARTLEHPPTFGTTSQFFLMLSVLSTNVAAI